MPADDDAELEDHVNKALRSVIANDPRAAAEFETLIEYCMHILGPDHAETVSARQDLAIWRDGGQTLAGAVAASEALLHDCLRVLGPDHHETLAAQHKVALWRSTADDAAGTVAAFEALVVARTRVLGADHPDTLSARHGLARWRGQAGDTHAAVIAFQKLVTDCTAVLGLDHPHTLMGRYVYASLDLTTPTPSEQKPPGCDGTMHREYEHGAKTAERGGVMARRKVLPATKIRLCDGRSGQAPESSVDTESASSHERSPGSS